MWSDKIKVVEQGYTMNEVIKVIFALIGVVSSILGIFQFYKLRTWKKEITWDDALRVAENLMEIIQTEKEFDFNHVIGLGRSGGIWGGWLAGNLNSLPFEVVDIKYDETSDGITVSFPGGDEILQALLKKYGSESNVLIVEGATSRGQTPKAFLKLMKSNCPKWSFRTAVLYKNVASDANIDFVGKYLDVWPKRLPWHKTKAYKPYLRDIFAKHAA